MSDPQNTPDDDEDVGLEPDEAVFEQFARDLRALRDDE